MTLLTEPLTSPEVGMLDGAASRARLLAFTDGLLDATRPYASPSHSLITMPGRTGGYGRAIDGLEGFARTFLAAGFRLAGERGRDPRGDLERYAQGIAAGVDPTHPERWTRMSEHAQAKVEAASIALILDMTRPWLWEDLAPRTQQQLVDYLAEAVGDETYPQINWVWFRLVVQTFLRSVGGPHSLAEMQADLDTHDTFAKAEGWLADGDTRAFDHYTGWALHLYPTLWARMDGAADLAAPRRTADRERLDRFLTDAVHLLGADGAPLVQGRSLIYRFAAAAPYWVGALEEVPSVPLGQLRRAGLRVVDHFRAHGVPNADGLLDLGWWQQWLPLAQSYSGTGSPYWASKGLLGLALPADHPVWSAPEVALPSEDAVTASSPARAITAPVWGTTTSDGLVTIANHGVDHAHESDQVADSPLYARLAYTTATAPLLDEDAWLAPVDSSVVFVAGDGARSHRAGWQVLTEPHVDEASGAVVLSSLAAAHWVRPHAQQMRHGSGIEGEATTAGRLRILTVARGAWHVHLIEVLEASPQAVALELGGWPLAAGTAPEASESAEAGHAVVLEAAGLRTAVHGLTAWSGTRVHRATNASPMGEHAAAGVLGTQPRTGWHAAAVCLTTGTVATPPALTLQDSRADLAWADGGLTSVTLPELPHPRGEHP